MGNRFMKGIICPAVNAPIKPFPEKYLKHNEFLILILLFILLAASPALRIDSRYVFIIIMAIIGLGGVGNAFGSNSR